MSQHLIDGVKEYVELPFPDKLAITQVIIRRQVRELGNKAPVAFSGGKDSLVTLHMVREEKPNVPVVFNNTGVEFPETVTFVHQLWKDWGLNLIELHPQKSFWDCIEQYGWPTGSKRGGKNKQCCYWLKEKPMLQAIRTYEWLGYFTGITAAESYSRMFNARDHGTCHLTKKHKILKIHPILWWTEDEVWNYIKDHALPYNSIYDKGAHRCGCAVCTAHKLWESQLRLVNPKLYALIKLRKDGQYSWPDQKRGNQ